VQNFCLLFAGEQALSASFFERTGIEPAVMKKATDAALGYARVTGERTVELVHRSPADRKVGQAAFTSSSGRGRTRQELRIWNCAARREKETAFEPSQVHQGVST
jgi:hypothetical protein